MDPRRKAASLTAGAATLCWLLLVAMSGCTRDADSPGTPLPTRQTTIDPVKSKLEAAQQETERRRSEAERAGQ